LWRKNAAQGEAWAQYKLGLAFLGGQGTPPDASEAARWLLKAAQLGHAEAQYFLGSIYASGNGLPQDFPEAIKWWHKAADQGDAFAQNDLGGAFARGRSVPQDYVEAYKWYNLAAAQGDGMGISNRNAIIIFMTPSQIAEGQRLARDFKPRAVPEPGAAVSGADIADSRPASSGTGFFISADGFLITSAHVVEGATQIRLLTRSGLISAKAVNADVANDLALLKAEGTFAPLPVVPSRALKLGATVATVGFPNTGLQGFAPKLAKGEIASLSGAGDDARYFQISVPVQPGNSGGALVDDRGNVVGIVAARLSEAASLMTTGVLPQNVNYAVKSSYLLSFLESVPEVSAKLKEANAKEMKFEDVVGSAEQAAVLVLVY
jgi:S1-C subfamily serine protease